MKTSNIVKLSATIVLILGILLGLRVFKVTPTSSPSPIGNAPIPSVSKGWNYETQSLDGHNHTEVSSKWVNYLDADGSFKTIDTAFKDCGDFFCIGGAPFKVEIPKTSTGIANFINDNRYDVFNDSVITDPTLTQSIKALDVTDVPGEIETGDLGWGESNYVIYKNAYPNLKADLIYYVQHGAAPRLMKLVRFSTQPSTTDFDLQFEVSYSDPITIAAEKAVLSTTDRTKIATQLATARTLEAQGNFRASALAEEVALKTGVTAWSQATKLTTKKGLAQALTGSTERGISFKDFKIWDSTKGVDATGVTTPQKSQLINVTYEKQSGNTYILTKQIPASFFTGVTYPVYTDTTSTFYPDPDAEVTSVDGAVGKDTSSTDWATVHDATTGTHKDDSATQEDESVNYPCMETQNISASARYDITRCFLLFDTSAITAGATINSATLTITTGTSINNGDDDGDDWINVFQAGALAANTSLSTADYNKCSTTAGATNKDITAVSANTAYAFTLNATGLTWVTAAGITKLCMLEGHDAINSAIATGGNLRNNVGVKMAEQVGTGSDPTLVVDWTASAGGARRRNIIGDGE